MGELCIAEKGLVNLDNGESNHPFKFRNAIVSLGLEEGGSEGQQRDPLEG